jgi:HAD superfamily hydrolase (TIGR01509 family)
MIKAVIFDMDGVIIDSEPIYFESDKMTMKYYEKEITDEELNNYVGVTNPAMWVEIREKYKLIAPIEELLEKQFYYKNLLFRNKKLEPIAGIIKLLDELKSCRIKIGLASSSSKDFIELILNSLGVIDYFDAIISGEEVQNSKPAPDIFKKAAEVLNVEPSSCLVIEDSMHGVKAAKLAEMKCIGFFNPNSGKQDLSLADAIVYSIEEINHRNY